jgi:outer membrane protein, adhesin transport system
MKNYTLEKSVKALIGLALTNFSVFAEEASTSTQAKEPIQLEDAIQADADSQVGKALIEPSQSKEEAIEELSPSAKPGPKVMTLSEALKIAHEYHPEMLSKKYTIDQFTHNYEGSKGSWLPTVNYNMQWGPERNVDRLRTATDTLKDTENQTTEVHSVKVRQLLFDSDRTNSAIDQNQQRLAQSRFDFDQTKEGLTFAVISAYVELLRQSKLKKLAAENFKRHQDLHNKVKNRSDLKRETKVSLAQAGSRLLRAKNFTVQTDYSLRQAKTAYYQLIGAPAPEQLDEVTMDYFTQAKSLFEAFRLAQNHPALKRSKSKLIEAQSRVITSKAANGPEIALELNSYYDRDANGQNAENEEYNALITLNWNLYRGGQDKHAYRGALSDVLVNQNDYKTIEREINESVEDAWIELEKLRANLEILLEQKDLARFTADGFVEQYDKSGRSLFDVLNAETDAFNTETSYISAQYDEIISFARLGFFMGDITARIKARK